MSAARPDMTPEREDRLHGIADYAIVVDECPGALCADDYVIMARLCEDELAETVADALTADEGDFAQLSKHVDWLWRLRDKALIAVEILSW